MKRILIYVVGLGLAACTTNDAPPDEATAAAPATEDAALLRATTLYREKNYEGAITALQQAMSFDSTNIEYHYLLADVYMDYYRSRLALRTLERAAKLDPDRLETQLRLAETQLILRQYDDALRSVNEATRLDPRNPEAYLLLSQVYEETGDTTRAIRAAEEATQIDPDFTDAFLVQAQLRAATGDPRAADYFDAAIGINPEDPYALHAKADYLRDQDRLSEAVALYRRASLADRQYVAGHFNAGLLLLEQDSVQAARREFEITLKNDPVHIRAFFFRGYTKELLGDPAGAAADYRVAVRMSPDYTLALEGLERVGG